MVQTCGIVISIVTSDITPSARPRPPGCSPAAFKLRCSPCGSIGHLLWPLVYAVNAIGSRNKRGIAMERATDKLVQDLRAVMTDAEELLKATAGAPGEQIEKLRERAEESLRVARESMKEAGVELEEQVRRHPWAALGIAAGVGLVLGLLLSRK